MTTDTTPTLQHPNEPLAYADAITYVERFLEQHAPTVKQRTEGWTCTVYDYLDHDAEKLAERPWLGVRVAEVSFSHPRGGASYMQVDGPWGTAFCGEVERCVIALIENWNREAYLRTDDGDAYWYLAETDEEFWRLERLVESAKKPEGLQLTPDDASDLLTALSEVMDRHGKTPEDEDELQQVDRWQALAERVEPFGDWEQP